MLSPVQGTRSSPTGPRLAFEESVISPEHWQEVCDLLVEALDLPLEERDSWVRSQSAAPPEVLAEVEALLVSDRAAGQFLERSVRDWRGGAASWNGSSRKGSSLAGRALGPYRLLTCLGGGRTSRVYLAARGDDEYRQRVAVKVLRQGLSEDAHRRLRAERQILAALDHPNICRFLLGDTIEEGLPFFAMEFVDGLRVDQYCMQQRLSVEKRLDLFVQICDAVDHAHRNLIVHRDLKPGNILINREGQPKLLDFGIAKLLNPQLAGVDLPVTEKWVRHLTPAYASPEQVRGEPITAASDIYSLGVLFYELLTGVLPLRIPATLLGAYPAEVERILLEEVPQKPSLAVSREEERAVDDPGGDESTKTLQRIRNLRPPTGKAKNLSHRLAGDLDSILLKALRKEPNQRYESAKALGDDLRRHLQGETVLARDGTLWYQGTRLWQRHGKKAAVGLGAAVLLFAFALNLISQAKQIESQERAIALGIDQVRQEEKTQQQVLGFLEDLFAEVGVRHEKGEEVQAVGLLRLGLEKIDRYRGGPEVRGDLLTALGRNFHKMGYFQEAEETHRRALRLRQETFGERSLEAASSLDELSLAIFSAGRPEDAEALARRALEIKEELGLGGSLEMARSAGLLALSITARGRLVEAEELFRQTLAIRRHKLDPESDLVVESLSDLGTVLGMAGRFEQAESYLREILEVLQRVPDPDPVIWARTLRSLAFVLKEQGKLTSAEATYREALERWRQLLPLGDPQLGFALHSLGRIYLRQKRFEEAEEVFLQYQDLNSQGLPKDHWRQGLAVGLLGTALLAQERYREAESLLTEGLSVVTASRGEEFPDAVLLREHLADLYEKTGRQAQAARLRGR